MNTALIVTTINPVNDVMKALARGAVAHEWDFIVIGDKKGPVEFNLKGAEFFSVEQQRQTGLALAQRCPLGHYARKNIGYLLAASKGAEVIVETDDDNFPHPEFFAPRRRQRRGRSSVGNGWTNVYRHFHKSNIWPRGFPLRHIQDRSAPLSEVAPHEAPIQQGLADGNPDVDAIYRSLHLSLL